MNAAIKITVEAVRIDHHGIDPITLIIEDIAPGQGRIIVECFGAAWSAWWGGMAGKTTVQFVAGCHADYIASKLWPEGMKRRTDREDYLRCISGAVIEYCKQQ